MSPYENLPSRQFWKSAIAEKNLFDICDIWNPKFPFTKTDRVSTYGSCFAQHIGKALLERGYAWFDTEPAPVGLSRENTKLFNYSRFSSRTQNIYTSSMLEQWVDWSLGIKEVPNETWEHDNRFYDPFRPTIEPHGFCSAEEMKSSLDYSLQCFKSSITKSSVIIFTLGLTERWVNKNNNCEYSICPGTAVGHFDESKHAFNNLLFSDVYQTLISSMEKIRDKNKSIKFILTVSPVPLVATQLKRHVLISTIESKSILRAVAGQLCIEKDYVDYFPSYEIISSFPFAGVFYDPNKRSVSKHGVNFVMDRFFQAMEGNEFRYQNTEELDRNVEETACEEELLSAFAK